MMSVCHKPVTQMFDQTLIVDRQVVNVASLGMYLRFTCQTENLPACIMRKNYKIRGRHKNELVRVRGSWFK